MDSHFRGNDRLITSGLDSSHFCSHLCEQMDSISLSRHLALRLPHLLAQVEMRLNPALREQAFVVATGREPRSQVLGLSPALEATGRPGETLAAWLRRHPGLLVVEGRAERVQALLEAVRTRLAALLPGAREERGATFLLSLRGSTLLFPHEEGLARHLLDSLSREEGLLAAVGIGSSPLAARLLCRRARAGEWHAAQGEAERSLLDGFPLAGLPELSSSLLCALGEVGVRTVGEARTLSPSQLQRLYGMPARRLSALLGQLDDHGTAEDPTTAPLQASQRLSADSADPALLESHLLEVLEVVLGRAREAGRAPQSVELTLLWNDGLRQTRHARLRPQHEESRRQCLRRTGRRLLGEALEARRLRVRELGIMLDTEKDSSQLRLFASALSLAPLARPLAREAESRECLLDQALLQLRRRWGPGSISLGTGALRLASGPDSGPRAA